MDAKIVLSYSHKDEGWREYVESHLNVLAQHTSIDVWSDQKITGGSEWLSDIRTAFDEADIVILLVSRYFLSSRFILDEEVPDALRRRIQGRQHIYPILLSDTAWTIIDWLASLQMRPRGGISLERLQLPKRNKAMVQITQELSKYIQDLSRQAS